MNGTSKPTSQASSRLASLDSDIAFLTSFLAQPDGSDEHDVEGPELQELLRRLETTDGVAREVESRLDDIIGNLDQMLGGLEAAGQESSKTHSQHSEQPRDDEGVAEAKSGS